MKLEIEETTDYDVFKTHESNRKVDQKLIDRLENSIRIKNMLHSRPILIDKEFHVIDGQHRLEVAKRMGIPIPYCIAEDCEISDMLRLNANQKTWSMNDYLNYYCTTSGHNEYLKLKEFLDREKIQLNIALQLLNGNRSGDFYTKFKDGFYEFPNGKDLEEIQERNFKVRECIKYIKKVTSGPKTYLDRVTFYGALIDFFNIKSFVYDVFMKKLQYKIDFLRPCTRQCDYVSIFKTIYNWKNHEPLKESEE